MINLSAALIGGAGRFLSLFCSAGADEDEAFRGFGRLNGFVALRGLLTAGLIGFSLSPPVGAAAAAADSEDGVDSLAEKESTTFSVPSSRLRPSDTAVVIVAGVSDGPASAFARSICSAMSVRSRCSSDVVERSFLRAAS